MQLVDQSSCYTQHHKQHIYAPCWLCLDAWEAMRNARFFASDSERRSRASFMRCISTLWYSAASARACFGGDNEHACVGNPGNSAATVALHCLLLMTAVHIPFHACLA